MDTLLLYGQTGEQEQYDRHVKNSDIGVSKQSLQSGGCSSKESTTSGRSSATPTQSLL